MRFKYNITFAVCGVILLILSALALYYRQQAVFYQREWKAAVALFNRQAPEPVTLSPAPAKRETAAFNTRATETNYVAPVRSPESDRQSAEHPVPLTIAATPQRPPEPDRFQRRDSNWMENLRTSDPQRYEEMQRRRQEMREYIQNAWEQRTNYFRSRDTSKMTESELEEYSAMMTLLDETWTLSQRMQADLPADERRRVLSAVRSNMVALAPMLEDERNHEYYDLAVGMGHSEAEAAAFAGYVNQITSNTSLRTIFPGTMRGGMPRGRLFDGNSPGSIPSAK